MRDLIVSPFQDSETLPLCDASTGQRVSLCTQHLKHPRLAMDKTISLHKDRQYSSCHLGTPPFYHVSLPQSMIATAHFQTSLRFIA